jgi:hypothetical protein
MPEWEIRGNKINLTFNGEDFESDFSDSLAKFAFVDRDGKIGAKAKDGTRTFFKVNSFPGLKTAIKEIAMDEYPEEFE